MAEKGDQGQTQKCSFADIDTLPKICVSCGHLGGDQAMPYLKKLCHVQL